MNEIELTKLFVEYKETANKLADLDLKIKEEVLRLGVSQQIAGVKATYYQPGNETPDYETAARLATNVPPETIKKYTTTTTSVKWSEVCREAGIEVPPGSTLKSGPTLTVSCYSRMVSTAYGVMPRAVGGEK